MDRAAQLAELGIDIRDNPTLCPKCGKRTSVYKTKGNRRNRKCQGCGLRYVTQEVHTWAVNQNCAMADEALAVLKEFANAG